MLFSLLPPGVLIWSRCLARRQEATPEAASGRGTRRRTPWLQVVQRMPAHLFVKTRTKRKSSRFWRIKKKKNESSHGSLVAACALVFPQHPVAHPAEGGGSVLCLLFQGEIPRFAFPFALFPPRVRFSYSASPAAWFLRYRRSGTKLKAKMALTRRS